MTTPKKRTAKSGGSNTANLNDALNPIASDSKPLADDKSTLPGGDESTLPGDDKSTLPGGDESTLTDSQNSEFAGVKLVMPMWDSVRQKAFSIGDIYPCNKAEAARLVASGAAVTADD
ncbi:hypothetical protein [Vibrio fluvialis]|uniref:hypothetical protein n=1 Tax=Vibrio fluvialis TaxID=676 RepID=UPI0039996CD4